MHTDTHIHAIVTHRVVYMLAACVSHKLNQRSKVGNNFRHTPGKYDAYATLSKRAREPNLSQLLTASMLPFGLIKHEHNFMNYSTVTERCPLCREMQMWSIVILIIMNLNLNGMELINNKNKYIFI